MLSASPWPDRMVNTVLTTSKVSLQQQKEEKFTRKVKATISPVTGRSATERSARTRRKLKLNLTNWLVFGFRCTVKWTVSSSGLSSSKINGASLINKQQNGTSTSMAKRRHYRTSRNYSFNCQVKSNEIQNEMKKSCPRNILAKLLRNTDLC